MRQSLAAQRERDGGNANVHSLRLGPAPPPRHHNVRERIYRTNVLSFDWQRAGSMYVCEEAWSYQTKTHDKKALRRRHASMEPEKPWRAC